MKLKKKYKFMITFFLVLMVFLNDLLPTRVMDKSLLLTIVLVLGIIINF